MSACHEMLHMNICIREVIKNMQIISLESCADKHKMRLHKGPKWIMYHDIKVLWFAVVKDCYVFFICVL